jgi:hypothetical protein
MSTEKDSYVLRLIIDFTTSGTRQILIMGEKAEDRERGLRKVEACLSLIELLEQEIQREEIPVV